MAYFAETWNDFHRNKDPTAPDLVQVRDRPYRFIFCVESTGVMPPQLIVKLGLDVLSKKIDTVATEVAKGEDHDRRGQDAGHEFNY